MKVTISNVLVRQETISQLDPWGVLILKTMDQVIILPYLEEKSGLGFFRPRTFPSQIGCCLMSSVGDRFFLFRVQSE